MKNEIALEAEAYVYISDKLVQQDAETRYQYFGLVLISNDEIPLWQSVFIIHVVLVTPSHDVHWGPKQILFSHIKFVAHEGTHYSFTSKTVYIF
jgi:hypothetical protein